MEAIRTRAVLAKDGVVSVTGLPFKKGQRVELLVIGSATASAKQRRLTARTLLKSGLVGIWRNRRGIRDSVSYARRLRDEAQSRRRG